MKVTVYSTHKFEKEYLIAANANHHELSFLDMRLTEQTAALCKGSRAVCVFVTDDVSAPVIAILHDLGVQYLVLRSAGYNNVDLKKAKEAGIKVARVPQYSPYAVAEHAVALMLALNRKLIQAHSRIMEQNFSLDGLVGFDMHGKTIGIIGTGKIGCTIAKILHGFGCKLLAFDQVENKELKDMAVNYTTLDNLFKESDIITLHVPLTTDTRHMVNNESILHMKPGIMLINTSRGGLINTRDVVQALKQKHIGSFGMDVYEEEEGLFFEDHSEDILLDDVIVRLMAFKNVLITSHQAFLTDTALTNIAGTTKYNLDCFENGLVCENELL